MNKHQKLINQITRMDLSSTKTKVLYPSLDFRQIRMMNREVLKGQPLEVVRLFKKTLQEMNY